MAYNISFTWNPDRSDCLRVRDRGFGETFAMLADHALDVANGVLDIDDVISLGDTIDAHDFLNDLEDWIGEMRDALGAERRTPLIGIGSSDPKIRAAAAEAFARGFTPWP